MNPFDVAAVLMAIAAVAGYVNHRLLKLPATSGTLVVALVSSFVVIVVEAAFPRLGLRESIAAFLGEIDFNQTLMHGMLCFLLFAGALHVDLEGLFRNKWTIGALATVGVLLSTAVVGLLTWWLFGLIGASVPLVVCLTFGALISPTDPIAVMGLLKELRAPASLEAQIAGESLFNDGVSVVVFFAMVSVAGLAGSGEAAEVTVDVAGLSSYFLREVGGGVALGLAFGFVGYHALLSLDDHPLELLITLALAMFMYTVSFWVGVSGPIAIVTAGLLIGNPGRRFAMSDRTREHVDAFWSMVDEILNAVLFLLIGLEFLAVELSPALIAAGLLAIPIALAARLVSVAVPVTVMSVRGRFVRGLVPVLTWSGLRGGISVAMVLSLPRFPARDLLLASTYAVVIFSILVQGLTVRRVLVHYGIGETESVR
ncbi:MAG: cation:proton antiporter [Vicinamibacterales bacterium]